MNEIQIVDQLIANGIDDCQILKKSVERNAVEVFQQTCDRVTMSNVCTYHIQAMIDHKRSCIIVEEDEITNIEAIVQTLKDTASYLQAESDVMDFTFDNEKLQEIQQVDVIHQKSWKEKVACFLDLETKILAQNDKIEQVMGISYEENKVEVVYCNSNHQRKQQVRLNAYIAASILVSDQEEKKSAYEVERIDDWELFSKESFMNRLVQKGISQLQSKSLKSGSYPMLLKNQAMASMLKQFMSLFHGEKVAQNVSLLHDKKDQTILSNKITIKEDPMMPKGHCNCLFDEEGIYCTRKTLVKNGVLKQFVHNLKSAKKCGDVPGGNAFALDIDTTNIYIEANNTTIEEMMTHMQEGILIEEVTGLHAGWNSVTTDFSLQASGFYIKDGVIQYPISTITIAANAFELWNQVEMVGNDLQWITSGYGAPSILFKTIALSGDAKE